MLTIESTYHRTKVSPRRDASPQPTGTYSRGFGFSGPARGALPAILAACVATLLLGVGVARAAPVLEISGAGDGHGVGMSQNGALGYAEHDWTYQAILAHYYTGTALGQAPAGATVRVLVGGKVQTLPLETYVRGVVSAEMPSGWPLAALEAQAVASRTYALTAHAGGSKFDVYADTRSQVYRGVAAETPQTDTAILDTAGQVVTYGGNPAITYFFASSGGRTENVENGFPGVQPQPWLRGVTDAYETTRSGWKLGIPFATVAARLKGLVKGSFRGIEVLSRGFSPRILRAAVLGSGGATQVSGPELEARLGLDSTWAYFSVKNGAAVKPEPDRSAQPGTPEPADAPATPSAPVSTAPPAPAPAATPSASVSAVSGAQGGAQAPGAPAISTAGGTIAG
ncbi:MAG TPA: SpoIID/LytB domain-containing protein [Solirubrobacteraceae bacterium]|jgi:SpoIID/LytB domain protein